VTIRFKRMAHNPDLPLPNRETEGAAGYDVRSAEDTLEIKPMEIRAVRTGLMMELPQGVECQVRPRSGLAARHGVTVPNSPGTIDPDYRGELKVLLQNLGPAPVEVARGDRVAQLVFSRFEAPEIVETDVISSTDRGQEGFGSTGRG